MSQHIISYACPDANLIRERIWKLSTHLTDAPHQAESARDHIRQDRANPAYEDAVNELALHIRYCPTCRAPRFQE